MSWRVEIFSKAKKQIKRLPRFDQVGILGILESLEINPYQGDLQKLKGEENVWRRRVGNYRIIFEIVKSTMVVLVQDIKRRSSKTYSHKK
ncbi:MAG: type II toxin-antitoxin system RelE/ParE family toxin [Patescibacteria group bacterium]